MCILALSITRTEFHAGNWFILSRRQSTNLLKSCEVYDLSNTSRWRIPSSNNAESIEYLHCGQWTALQRLINMDSPFPLDKVVMTPGLSPNWRPCTLLFCCGAIASRLIKKDKLLWKTVFCYTDLELGMNAFILFKCWPSDLDSDH